MTSYLLFGVLDAGEMGDWAGVSTLLQFRLVGIRGAETGGGAFLDSGEWSTRWRRLGAFPDSGEWSTRWRRLGAFLDSGEWSTRGGGWALSLTPGNGAPEAAVGRDGGARLSGILVCPRQAEFG